MPRIRLLLCLVALSATACSSGDGGDPATNDAARPGPTPAPYAIEIDRVLPHDAEAFTQGLVFADGVLYESTGLEGQSEVRRVELASGTVLDREALPDTDFGEGLALHDGSLHQLTWRNERGYVRDQESLETTAEFTYDTEGWGLASDGERLVMTDGTDVVRFLDPQTHAETGSVRVTDRGEPVTRLNELEVVDGELLANVWQTTWIARINLESGEVVGWIDGALLAEEAAQEGPVDVLNGIAADPATDRLWLTGKLWPVLFEVTLVTGDQLPAPGGE